MEEKKKGYKGNIAFFYKSSWYHRKKELTEDGITHYGKVGGFKTPEEAEQSYYIYQKKYEENCEKILPKINEEISLKSYIIYCFENVFSKNVEDTTAMITSYVIYSLIIPNIMYDIKVRLVTTEFINEILDRIDNLGKTTANKSREVLKMVFNAAVKDKITSSNPVSNAKEYRRGKVNIIISSKDEIKNLLKETVNSNWYFEILLALFCGLRKGEIRGLKFTDFDFENKIMRITRQLSASYKLEPKTYKILKKNNIEKEPKTQNGIRSLKVPTIIIDEVLKRKEIYENFKNNYGDSFVDNDYISFQINGLPRSESSFNLFLSRTCKKISLPKISVHGLRHMYATILIEQGVSLARISALLGHGSIHTTFDLYVDAMEEKSKILALMNNAFSVTGEASV